MAFNGFRNDSCRRIFYIARTPRPTILNFVTWELEKTGRRGSDIVIKWSPAAIEMCEVRPARGGYGKVNAPSKTHSISQWRGWRFYYITNIIALAHEYYHWFFKIIFPLKWEYAWECCLILTRRPLTSRSFCLIWVNARGLYTWTVPSSFNWGESTTARNTAIRINFTIHWDHHDCEYYNDHTVWPIFFGISSQTY